MIERVTDIISENPIKQVWKQLRLFLDPKYTSETIFRIYPSISTDHKQNIKKQAVQIGYCIRQAEEYFLASTQVGLATRPVLSYYGAVALSQATVLLRNTGNYSFDFRRKHPEFHHNHHGLEPMRGSFESIKPDFTVKKFFESLQCKVFLKDKNPWGHFPLFYNSLVPGASVMKITFYDPKHYISAPKYETRNPYPGPDITPLNLLTSSGLGTLELLRALPDMFYVLRDLEITSHLIGGYVSVKYPFCEDKCLRRIGQQRQPVAS